MSRPSLFALLAIILAMPSAVEAQETGEPGDVNAPARVIEITMQDARGQLVFAPDTVTVTQGEQIRFRLKNEGELDHEFVLGSAEDLQEHAEMMKAMPNSEHEAANGKRVVAKGTGDLVWRFAKAGTFEFACLVPGHFEAGMHGTIIVK